MNEGVLTLRRREFIATFAGAVVAGPISASAQQKPTAVIVFLGAVSPAPQAAAIIAFLKGLSESGYIQTKNLTIEQRWAEDNFDRLPALAADLVSCKVDLIVTFGGPAAALAAKRATSKIPIVFNAAGDPIAAGLVGSLAHSGGNVTGFSNLVDELNTKRFELLLEMVPTAKIIALLINPNTASSERVVHDVSDAAGAKKIQLAVLRTGTQSEVAAAFSTIQQQHLDALLVSSDPSFGTWREYLVALASRYGVPAIYEFSEFVELGGLASYGYCWRIERSPFVLPLRTADLAKGGHFWIGDVALVRRLGNSPTVSVTDRTFFRSIIRPAFTLEESSKAKNRPSCRYSSQPTSSWLSI